MLLTVSLRPEKPAGRSSKRARHERVEPGSVVQGTVLEAHPLHVDVQLSDGGSSQTPGCCENTLVSMKSAILSARAELHVPGARSSSSSLCGNAWSGNAGPRGRLHVMETDLTDAKALAAAYPARTAVRAVSVGLVADADGRRAAVQELTTRKDALTSAEAGRPVKPKLALDAAAAGRTVTGCASC